MTFRKILSNSALILSGEVIERILRLVLVIFSARILGDTAYGKFTFALSFTSLFLILADGGLHQLIVREIARDRHQAARLIANALPLKLIFSVATISLIYFFGNLTGKQGDVIQAIYIMGWAMIAGSFGEFFTSIFRAHQKMLYDVIATLIFGSLVTVSGLAILISGFDYLTLAYVYLGASLIRLLYCAGIAHLKFVRIKFGFDLLTIKFLIRHGFPFGVLYFFSLMYTYIDSTMLSLMVDDQTVGWYNAAYRLVFAMMFIPVALMKAVFPALSMYYKESKEQFATLFERSFKVLFLVGFSLASVLTMLADRIIVLIFGDEYAPAAGALKILVWSAAIIFIGTVQTHTTRASNHQNFTAKVVASSAALNVVLNFVLIPKYSLYGAAFATIASELFTFMFHSIYLTRKMVAPPILRLAPKIAVICVCAMWYINMIYEFSLIFIVPTSFCLILLLVLGTRYFTRDETDFIRSLARSPGKVTVS